jgi:hypothetical protein
MDFPDLVANGQRYETDEARAEILMATFFPTPSTPDGCDPERPSKNREKLAIEWPRLTKHEVERAIFKSNPDKAPGLDEISFRVWRELWPVVGDQILWLYNTSLELHHTPKQWKTARIVLLRKPGKADYTLPKAFRPISLLPTISKGLEAVVAARLSFITETYNLLPSNHFGATPRRSAEQALNVLVENIYQAWRQGRVLSLISFDVKKAFNGVHSDVLEPQLAARQVPTSAIKWIRDFCNGRHAQVMVGSLSQRCHQLSTQGFPKAPLFRHSSTSSTTPILSSGRSMGRRSPRFRRRLQGMGGRRRCKAEHKDGSGHDYPSRRTVGESERRNVRSRQDESHPLHAEGSNRPLP